MGSDVQSIAEVEQSLRVFGVRYTHRLFTDFETEDFSDSSASPSWFYAERFAAKEAVLKLLDVRHAIPSWKEIEVRRKGDGELEVVLYGVAAELSQRRGFRGISVSVSHSGSVAIAVALAS